MMSAIPREPLPLRPGQNMHLDFRSEEERYSPWPFYIWINDPRREEGYNSRSGNLWGLLKIGRLKGFTHYQIEPKGPVVEIPPADPK